MIVQSQHIQHIKLETDGGADHPRKQLEEVGVEPTQEELTKSNMLEEEAEQQLNEKTIELESTIGGKLMPQERKTWGIELIYPLIRRKCKRASCKTRSHPTKELDDVS
jgi:hypothetical protein